MSAKSPITVGLGEVVEALHVRPKQPQLPGSVLS